MAFGVVAMHIIVLDPVSQKPSGMGQFVGCLEEISQPKVGLPEGEGEGLASRWLVGTDLPK